MNSQDKVKTVYLTTSDGEIYLTVDGMLVIGVPKEDLLELLKASDEKTRYGLCLRDRRRDS